MYKFLRFDILDLEKNDIGHGVLNQINKNKPNKWRRKRK